VAPRSEDPKLIIRVINFELVQPICPRYVNVTERRTDGRLRWQYGALHYVHRAVKNGTRKIEQLRCYRAHEIVLKFHHKFYNSLKILLNSVILTVVALYQFHFNKICHFRCIISKNSCCYYSIMFFLLKNTYMTVLGRPVQTVPLPVKPGKHLQTKLPSVLIQVANSLQLCSPVSHSLISENITSLTQIRAAKAAKAVTTTAIRLRYDYDPTTT